MGVFLATEVVSWLHLPTSLISKYGSVGKYSTDYLVSVTGDELWYAHHICYLVLCGYTHPAWLSLAPNPKLILPTSLICLPKK